MTRDEILKRDRAHVWHPYTAVDAWEKATPLVIERAEGSRLYDVDGRSYLDGNSSWWVAALGHGHPRLRRVMAEQAATLDHCAFAGITHEPSVRLAEELVAVAPPGLDRAFHTDNGSGSIEVAIKVALQTWKLRGKPQKTRFIALDGAYHGDTLGATSLCNVDVFKRPYAEVCFECVHAPFPEADAYERAFGAIRQLLETDGETIAAVVVEAIVQGSSGMRIYDPRYLTDLRALTKKHDVLLVTDEVFSGYGRTGKMWAADHAGITPDIMCIGKVFASMIPMAATLVTSEIYDAYRGAMKGRALYYGHTFCGNPIGAAMAREVLAIYRDEQIIERTIPKQKMIRDAFAKIGQRIGAGRVRSVGMIGAADLGGEGYLADRGWKVYEEGLKRGAYLRPLGDTVYVCPPLVIDDSELAELLEILDASILATD